jgi:hypothetical protein
MYFIPFYLSPKPAWRILSRPTCLLNLSGEADIVLDLFGDTEAEDLR